MTVALVVVVCPAYVTVVVVVLVMVAVVAPMRLVSKLGRKSGRIPWTGTLSTESAAQGLETRGNRRRKVRWRRKVVAFILNL